MERTTLPVQVRYELNKPLLSTIAHLVEADVLVMAKARLRRTTRRGHLTLRVLIDPAVVIGHPTDGLDPASPFCVAWDHPPQSGFSVMAGKLREDWKLTLFPDDHWDERVPAWVPYSNKNGTLARNLVANLLSTQMTRRSTWRANYGLFGWKLPSAPTTAP